MNAKFKAVKYSTLRRHLTTLMIFLSVVKSRVGSKVENIGHWVHHMTIYNRRPWLITFGVEDSEADGVVRYIAYDETHRVYRTYEKNFFIHNRWSARKCTNELVWQIMACAVPAIPGRVIDVGWGRYEFSRETRKPFDLSRLPSDVVIQQQNEKRLRFHAWLEKHFPTKQDSQAAQRAAARAIIFR